MANIQEFLDKAMSIDGALGTALVNYETGTCLGTKGGGWLDMELAGASAIKIVRAKTDIIQQLELDESPVEALLTMENQYHLIRLLPVDESVFAYLILEQEQGSLPLARTHLKSIGQELSLDAVGPPGEEA
ncbi:hypothetical protein BSZ35_18640 [Salinibacter sp. 10B]|uniref:hypothetical protein n=1 Tax=Salinibacter sp. 10B TaxID=1923971 RepID=UPI000CF39E4F|nr:hypothetical protein [Salinibacter sp. 10B]PQJ26943.1 hypothetical protein BSZ35_18640 [Salinibacter sp. 10B]